ncbi:MAG: ThuA domain-containing protein [Verrucomicrobiales bacterium]
MKSLSVPFVAIALSLHLHAESQPEELRVLMLTGGCCHDYEAQKEILAAGISERAAVKFTTLHEGGKGHKHQFELLKKKGWEKDFDVLLYNICFARETDVAYIESIVDTHKAGLPAVALHCSTHSYHWDAKTDEWESFLGVTSLNHGPKAPIKMTPVVKDHPVTKEFPVSWTTPQGELYNIQKVHESATVLIEGENGKSKQPCVWVNELEGARVFGTTVGHHNETMADPVYLDLVTRGLLWATQKLEEAESPTEGSAEK